MATTWETPFATTLGSKPTPLRQDQTCHAPPPFFSNFVPLFNLKGVNTFVDLDLPPTLPFCSPLPPPPPPVPIINNHSLKESRPHRDLAEEVPDLRLLADGDVITAAMFDDGGAHVPRDRGLGGCLTPHLKDDRVSPLSDGRLVDERGRLALPEMDKSQQDCSFYKMAVGSMKATILP